MEPGFELFDHTADVGIRARAATRAGLIGPATEGLYAAIGSLVPAESGSGAVSPGDAGTERWEFVGDDAAGVLRDYLAKLLRLFEGAQRVLVEPRAEAFDDRRLTVVGTSRPIDAARSALDREVKAVTYHGLSVRPIDGGWEAEVIVDI